MIAKKNKFEKRKIYQKKDKEVLTLIKCENQDGSLSYKLGHSDGYLVSHNKRSLKAFEDLINIHEDHQANLKQMRTSEKPRSIFGNNIDSELSKVQNSVYTYLEEIAMKI